VLKICLPITQIFQCLLLGFTCKFLNFIKHIGKEIKIFKRNSRNMYVDTVSDDLTKNDDQLLDNKNLITPITIKQFIMPLTQSSEFYQEFIIILKFWEFPELVLSMKRV